MTNLRASQIVRTSVVDPNPPLLVSQQVRQSIVNPFIPLRVSQVVRLTLIAAPQPETLYCWARQTLHTDITAVTAVNVGV